MRFYLDDNIFTENEIFHYEYGNNIIKIKEKNWHKYLSDYGWEKLNKQWIIKLNKLAKHKPKNSLFGVLDCGGEGDCLFNCISYAMNKDRTTDSETLRLGLSNYITEDKFNTIIEIYRILKDTDDFEEVWDPDLTSFEDFKKILREGGDNYWGDSIILDFLKEYLNLNIIIMYNNDITNLYYHYPLLDAYSDDKNTIILLYKNEIHFQLIGYFTEGRMNTIFNSVNIPEEILSMVKIR